jgi:hypothetical protein
MYLIINVLHILKIIILIHALGNIKAATDRPQKPDKINEEIFLRIISNN